MTPTLATDRFTAMANKANLFTVSQVAEKYDITRQRVWQLANERGIEPQKFGPIAVFTPEQVKALKPGKPGRPWPKKRKENP